MAWILTGLGLVLLIEGLVYALAPSIVEDLLAALRAMTIEQRRLVGLLAITAGLAFLWAGNMLGAL